MIRRECVCLPVRSPVTEIYDDLAPFSRFASPFAQISAEAAPATCPGATRESDDAQRSHSCRLLTGMSTLGVIRFSSCSRTSRRGGFCTDLRERRSKATEGSQIIVNLRYRRTNWQADALPPDHSA